MLNTSLNFIKRIIPYPLKVKANKLIPMPFVISQIHRIWGKSDPPNWPLPKCSGKQGVEKYEYSLFSQNGEDGILRYLFSEIGFRSRLFLEFGFGVTENNSLRLMLKESFGGVFLDGSELSVRRFNKAAHSLGIVTVKAVQQFLNLENLEPTILDSGLAGQIDLLSIDVDGNDYWFWEKIQCLSPRIVVVEYNASLGSELSLSIPYDPFFDRHTKHTSGFYCGASISAFERLGRKKGYSLVGCDSNGVNAFFIRNDCLTRNIDVLPAQLAYRPHRRRLERGFSLAEQFESIKDLPFINIA